jgi:hypothetical protein
MAVCSRPARGFLGDRQRRTAAGRADAQRSGRGRHAPYRLRVSFHTSGNMLPRDAVRGVPHVVAVRLVPALHRPHPAIEDRHVVVLARMPGSRLQDALPVGAVGGTPHIVVEEAPGPLRRVVGAAAQDPHSIPEHHAPADHPARRPGRVGRDLLPLCPVLRAPHVVEEALLGGCKLRHGLAAHHPDSAHEGHRVVQDALRPRHAVRDEVPLPAIRAAPHVVLIVVLVGVSPHDPHPAVVHHAPRRVAPLPGRLRVLKRPRRSIG